MLEASLAAAAGTATHRFATSKAHWAHGHGELSLGRSADPWRVAEARDRRLRTHGVPVSAGQLTRRSQTWRTFLANHIGNLAFASTVTASFATSDDDVDALVRPCRPVPPSRDGRYASNRWGLVDWPSSLPSTSLGWRVAQHQLRRRTRFSTGKDPPTSRAVNLCCCVWVMVPYVEEIHLGERLIVGRRPFDSESLVAIGKLWLTLRAIRSSTRLVT